MSSLADSEKRMTIASTVNYRDLQQKFVYVNSQHCATRLRKQHERRGNLSFFAFSPLHCFVVLFMTQTVCITSSDTYCYCNSIGVTGWYILYSFILIIQVKFNGFSELAQLRSMGHLMYGPTSCTVLILPHRNTYNLRTTIVIYIKF